MCNVFWLYPLPIVIMIEYFTTVVCKMHTTFVNIPCLNSLLFSNTCPWWFAKQLIVIKSCCAIWTTFHNSPTMSKNEQQGANHTIICRPWGGWMSRRIWAGFTSSMPTKKIRRRGMSAHCPRRCRFNLCPAAAAIDRALAQCLPLPHLLLSCQSFVKQTWSCILNWRTWQAKWHRLLASACWYVILWSKCSFAVSIFYKGRLYHQSESSVCWLLVIKNCIARYVLNTSGACQQLNMLLTILGHRLRVLQCRTMSWTCNGIPKPKLWYVLIHVPWMFTFAHQHVTNP